MTLGNLGVQICLRHPGNRHTLILGQREQRLYALIVTIDLYKQRQNALRRASQQAIDCMNAKGDIAHAFRSLRFGAPLFLETLLFDDFFLDPLAE
jgi:hypothetical protein